MSSQAPSAFDALMIKIIQQSGVTVLPVRPNLNFIGFTIVDNPTNNSTDVSGGSGAASTFPRVFDGSGSNSPYTVQTTDLITVFDNSSAGAAISATLPATPTLGEKHKFKWVARQNSASPAPTIAPGGSNSIENVGAPGTFGTAAQAIPAFGDEVEFCWLLTGASTHAWVLVG